MIKGNIENVITWLRLNGLDSFKLSQSKDPSKNDFIFKSNDDQPFDGEVERMRQVVALSHDPMLYVFAKKKGANNASNFSETWINDSNGVVMPVQGCQVNAVQGLSEIDINSKIENAIEKERLSWERREVERERKELRALKKELDDRQSSVIGTLVEKAYPFVAGMIQKATGGGQMQTVLSGVATDVNAETIKPVGKKEREEEEVFTEEESEELFDLVQRLKTADPDYLKVLNRIVEFAESGEEISVAGGLVKLNYQQIKDMIL